MRKWLVPIMALLIAGLFGSAAWAGELVNLQRIKEQPVNIFQYTKESVDVVAVILAKFLKTTNPVGLYSEEHTLGGAEITLVEGFLHPKLNLVGGVTLKNKEPSHMLFGIELQLNLKGDLGRAISRFRPGIYWSDDKWWFGVSLALRGLSIAEK